MPTRLPGTTLEEGEATDVFMRFIKRYRDESPLERIPTRCNFRVPARAVAWEQVFDDAWIADDIEVFFIEETPPMQRPPKTVHRATMKAVRDYLRTREPWEFADTYVLDLTMSWCLIITHDDDCLFAEASGQA